MDVSFDIHNAKGDQLRVALSYYDTEAIRLFTEDPLTLTLVFYDVTLVRVSGDENVGIDVLNAVCDVLYRFLSDNDSAVLCFYCDDLTEVSRRHDNVTPQEYRSRLFSRMFDKYIHSHSIKGIVNYCVMIEDEEQPRFAHFIAPEKYIPSIKKLGDIIMQK